MPLCPKTGALQYEICRMFMICSRPFYKCTKNFHHYALDWAEQIQHMAKPTYTVWKQRKEKNIQKCIFIHTDMQCLPNTPSLFNKMPRNYRRGSTLSERTPSCGRFLRFSVADNATSNTDYALTPAVSIQSPGRLFTDVV